MNSTNAMRKIATLNLDQVKIKLMHRQSGEGWSAARADAIEVEYRRFLCLLQMYPQEAIAPLVDVDIFWHYHILDTRKYAADCQQAFGHFVHHNPHIGLGEDNAADHQAFGARMHALYQATFGEACMGGIDGAAQGASAWCALVTASKTPATAWCALVDSAASQAGAWCARVDSAPAAATAWCALVESGPAPAAATAWCALVDRAPAQTSAQAKIRPALFKQPSATGYGKPLAANGPWTRNDVAIAA